MKLIGRKVQISDSMDSQPHIPCHLQHIAKVLWSTQGITGREKTSAGDNEAFLTWSGLKK